MTSARRFALTRSCGSRYPDARLTVAGSGPERADLEALAVELGVDDGVTFSGSLRESRDLRSYRSRDAAAQPEHGRQHADLDPGGVGVRRSGREHQRGRRALHLVDEGRNALLVDARRPDEMADAVLRVLESPALASSLAEAGRAAAEQCAWPVCAKRGSTSMRRWLVEPAQAKHARASDAVDARALHPCLRFSRLPPARAAEGSRHGRGAARARSSPNGGPPSGSPRSSCDRLRSLLQHASQHVPYYRDLLAQHAIVPTQLSSLAGPREDPLPHQAGHPGQYRPAESPMRQKI